MRVIKAEDFLISETIRDEVSLYLRGGGVVIFPTDTLYGLGVDISGVGAMENLIRLKGRDRSKPVPLIIDSAGRAQEIFDSFPPLGMRLTALYWPGKLTVVARARSHIASVIGALDGTVGVRMPASEVALSLARLCGGMVTGTSANKSGGTLPVALSDVFKEFGKDEVWLLDGGDLAPSGGSTVLLLDGKAVKVIREGDIPSEEILKIAEEFGNG
ncbi:MAG: L-threonylcarbamoyladenylate synthase [Deltaproteobacteria bacterium]|nr:L-threonylcarbamoyladenylate synthase [Deltaproteobacteria bacterium]